MSIGGEGWRVPAPQWEGVHVPSPEMRASIMVCMQPVCMQPVCIETRAEMPRS